MNQIMNQIKCVCALYLSLIPALFYSQSSNQNYISERLIKTPITNKTAIATLTANQQNFKVTYYDQFGRAVQSVIANGSNNTSNDLVNTIEYDQYNRKIKNYLPLPNPRITAGDYLPSADAATVNYYALNNNGVVNTSAPYANTIYDQGIGGKLLANGQFGEAWDVNVNPKNSSRYKYEATQYYEVPLWITLSENIIAPQSNKNEFGSLTPSINRGAKTKFYYDLGEIKKREAMTKIADKASVISIN
jgi:hypothetical protein